MAKELHIWMGKPPDHAMAYIDLQSTQQALRANETIIHTTQPHVCSTDRFAEGYRVYVHMLDGKTAEMKLGHIEDNPKEIRQAHNLERMLLANSFGAATIE